MNFSEALQALQQGKKVKHKSYENIYLAKAKLLYPDAEAILMWTNDKRYSDSNSIARDGEYWGVQWMTAYFEILEEDWEIVE